jgi:hypothetical protein
VTRTPLPIPSRERLGGRTEVAPHDFASAREKRTRVSYHDSQVKSGRVIPPLASPRAVLALSGPLYVIRGMEANWLTFGPVPATIRPSYNLADGHPVIRGHRFSICVRGLNLLEHKRDVFQLVWVRSFIEVGNVDVPSYA